MDSCLLWFWLIILYELIICRKSNLPSDYEGTETWVLHQTQLLRWQCSRLTLHLPLALVYVPQAWQSVEPSAFFVPQTHSSHSHPEHTPWSPFVSIWHITISFLRCPYVRSPTETIQQLYTFIKTQKVPGHRLCKSALFSEAESIKTAD